MLKPKAIDVLVGGLAFLAIALMAVAWQVREPYPGLVALLSVSAVAFMLDSSPTKLRVAAAGSTSFVIHIAAGVLFGAFWGGLITASSHAAWQLYQGIARKKVIFNAAQRCVAVTLAVLVYQILLGGSVPPSYLTVGQVPVSQVQRELLLFFSVSGVYVLVNTMAVSAAVALTTDRPFREVVYLNFRGVLGYDLGASVVSLLVAWFYFEADRRGWGPVGLIAVALPLVALRHVYALYHNLEATGQELLELMVKAIEARDPYTSGHSLRVKELSRAIALELELSSREIEEIETAALLHDVGKIHEEFAPLLRKESRLTPEETALMQTHASKSAELVGIISKFRGGVQRAVRHHHERWDGDGYPDGVKGKEIPLASRIILISDTIDAMTTDRPYRKRLGLDAVVAELQKCRGTQFDPELVEVAVSSVAVRRLINGVAADVSAEFPPRSKRVGGLAASLLRPRRSIT